MKYTVLGEFKRYLITCGLRPNTIKVYYSRVEHLLDHQYFINDGKAVDLTSMIHNMANIVYKNHFSQCKNALRYFLDCFDLTLDTEQLSILDDIGKKTKRKTRNRKQVNYKSVKKAILRLNNKKLKLSYFTMIATGLRVFELSQIRGIDCNILDDNIEFSFVGKGGMVESSCVEKLNHPMLYDNLKFAIESLQDENRKLFYSAKYLQKKAKEYNFTCHDLRRIYAKLEYKKTNSKIEVMQKLRHDRVKTTILYLNSPIKLE